MNWSALDRKELEDILLDPACLAGGHVCRDGAASVMEDDMQRTNRVRHVLEAAHELLVRAATRAIVGRRYLDAPTLVKEYLRVFFAGAERELFVTLYLDVQLGVIAAETTALGTLGQTAVYPREIVRRALHHNAASVILSHNHPSGKAEPSHADQRLTDELSKALRLIDVRVLDHIVVAGDTATSFAERGLLWQAIDIDAPELRSVRARRTP